MCACALAALVTAALMAAAPPASAATRADLKATSVTAPPSVVVGRTMQVTDTTKNAGRRRAHSSVTSFYLSTDATFDSGDTTIGSRDVPTLRPRHSSTATTEVAVPSDTTPGTYDVIACADSNDQVRESHENNNCRASAPVGVEHIPGVDAMAPPFAYSGINTPLTVYSAGAVAGEVTDVVVEPHGTDTETVIPATQDADDPVRVSVVLPSGLTPGPYDAFVRATEGDSPVTQNALSISSTINRAVTSVSSDTPADDASTEVKIHGIGFSGGAFAYAIPHGSTTATATDLHAQGLDTTTLSGVVPSGMDDGSYDVVVVNMDGTIGTEADAFTVVPVVPTITGITPSTLQAATSGQSLAIAGTNFDAPAVSLACKDTSNTASVVPATVSSSSATSISAVVDASSVALGMRCVVQVVDDGGGSASFGPLGFGSVTGGLARLSSSSQGGAPEDAALVASAPSSDGGYLYTIGGYSETNIPNGPPPRALSGVESTPIDGYGDPGTSTATANLPSATEGLGAARIGDFIYVVGGAVRNPPDSTGATVTANVYRAQILRSSDAPAIDSVNVTYPNGAASGGTYTYKVAATFADDDANNPSGESLPGVQHTVYVPANGGVDLTWSPVAGATGYRVYRTYANDTYGELLLLGTTDDTTTSFHDDFPTSLTAEVPLATGSVGHWASMPSMSSVRTVEGVAAATDPSDATKHYLYALGGYDGLHFRSDYEYLTVTDTNGGGQTVASSWTTGANALLSSAIPVTAIAVTHADATNVSSGSTFIYLVQGGTDAAPVATGGGLGSFTAVGSGVIRSGSAVSAFNGFLAQFGGDDNIGISNTISTARVQSTPPGLDAWSAAAATLETARVGADAVQYGPITYVAGGTSSSGMVTTLERFVD